MLDDKDYDPSYDEDFCVDKEGCCMCCSDEDYKKCPSFENDNLFEII